MRHFRVPAIALCLVFFAIPGLFAEPVSSQKLFQKDDYEYRLVETLCTVTGVAGPASVEPITAAGLLIALERVPEDKVPESMKGEYATLLADLAGRDEDSVDYATDIDVSPILYFAPSDMTRDEYFVPQKDEVAGLSGDFGFSFGNHVYLDGKFGLQNTPDKDSVPTNSFDYLLTFDGWKPQLGDLKYSEVLPAKARISLGNKWFNLTLGRTPHSFGNGFTGNMTIGDNFLYQELLMLTFQSDIFSYNISITQFDRQSGLTEFEGTQFNGKQQTRVIHRVELKPFSNFKFNFNLGALNYSDSSFNLKWLSPFSIAHSYFNYSEDRVLSEDDEANNIMSFEIEWTIAPKFALSGQLVIDQFQLSVESDSTVPTAVGGLLNFEWTEPLSSGYTRTWVEFAYTTPYLYLNEKYNDEEMPDPNYNYDHIFGYDYPHADYQMIGYSGYYYGPDTILVVIANEYENPDIRLDLSNRLMWKVQGEKGFLSPNLDNGDYAGKVTPTGTPEHEFALRSLASWTPSASVSIEVLLGFQVSWFLNYRHVSGDSEFVPQAYVGFTWHALD